ncbi:hypothetical protein PAEPH01_0546 [Pancytospora epiphaga]|nr:hypothetical protein PAEPH01_0546 [Pancytospora epiphaga]
MESIANMLLHQAQHLVMTTTDNLFDSFGKFKNGTLMLPVLLPTFLALAVLGIQLKATCAILLMLMLFPGYVLKALDVAKTLASSSGPGFLENLLEIIIDFLNLVKSNLPIFMGLLGISLFIIHRNAKHSNAIFYTFIIASYYVSEIFNPDFRAYFDILAFLKILAVLPLLMCILLFESLNNFMASLLYSFSGIWGIINLSMRLTGAYDKDLLERILEDILYPNYVTMGVTTAYFCMVISICIFTQFSLKAGRDSKTLLEPVEEKSKHIH